MGLKFAKAPRLPAPSPAYSSDMLDQFQNLLRLYFNQIDSSFATVLGPQGGQYLNTPYGAFEDTISHTVTANTANVMTFNTTDYSNGVTMVANSKITVAVPGIYNLQFSTQFQNTDTQLHDVSVWLRKNGTDITGSTGYISVPNQHGGTPGHGINGWNFFVELAGNDYIELWWSATNAAVTIQAYPADTSPTRPSTASNVVTLSFVSSIPE